jgi:hypothetical protein
MVTPMLIKFVAVAAVVAVPAVRADATSHSHARCAPAHARTLASSKYARAFKRGDFDYVCDRRSGKTLRLGPTLNECDSSIGCGGIDLVRLSGRWVGYESFLADRSSATSTIEVRSFRSGRILHHIRIGGDTKDGEEQAGSGALVLKRNGSAAWISTVRLLPKTDPPSTMREVHRFDRTGHAVVDSAIAGSNMDISGLRLDGSVLSWLKMGERKSIVLH